MPGHLWEGYVIEDVINTLGDDFQYYFYRTADGAECNLLIFNGEICLAAIDAKFAPQPKRTKSMAITIQDLRPKMGVYVIPVCQHPYNITDNQLVVSPWEINNIILNL